MNSNAGNIVDCVINSNLFMIRNLNRTTANSCIIRYGFMTRSKHDRYITQTLKKVKPFNFPPLPPSIAITSFIFVDTFCALQKSANSVMITGQGAVTG